MFIVLCMVLLEWYYFFQMKKKKSLLLFKFSSTTSMKYSSPKQVACFSHTSLVLVVVFYIILYVYIFSHSLWAPKASELSLFIGSGPGWQIFIECIGGLNTMLLLGREAIERRSEIKCYFLCPLSNVNRDVICRKSNHVFVSMISYLWNHCFLHQRWRRGEQVSSKVNSVFN